MASQITTLPPDVLIHLLIKLRPVDVIRLRRTCKDLYNASLEHSVWLGQMRRLRDERHLFFPECLLQRLSVSSLEAAATSPGRWSDLVMNPKDRTALLYPIQTRVCSLMNHLDKLQECPTETSPFYLENLQAHLVPGGQYLVTWSGRWLSLWNVGLEAIDPAPLVAVTCIKDYRHQDFRTQTRVYGMTVQATADGEGLRVLVYDHHAESIWRCFIYDIDLSAEVPSFTKVAMLDGPVDAPIDGYTLSGDILVAIFPTHEIWVWNFVQNAWAKWHGGISRNHECVLVNCDYLFLAEKYSLRSRPHCRLFKIPDLIQYPWDTHPVNIPSVPALASLANDFLSAFQYRGDVIESISPVSNWRVSSPGDPIFLTRRTIHSDANTLLQILVIKVDTDSDVPSVSCMPSQIPCINPDANRCQITFSSESLTDCLLLRNNDNIRVCTQHASDLLSTHGLRETDESVGPHIIGEVAENMPIEGWMLGFSPAAGRISLSPDDPGYEVHVWDFV